MLLCSEAAALKMFAETRVCVKFQFLWLFSSHFSPVFFFQGEDVWEAAAREVFEETGVRAEFEYLVCFRHQHGFHFGNSDLYMICAMRPLTLEIKKCNVEISDACWMDVSIVESHCIKLTLMRELWFIRKYLYDLIFSLTHYNELWYKRIMENDREVFYLRHVPVLYYSVGKEV